MLFRTGPGRGDFTNYSDCPAGFRMYFFKTPELVEKEKEMTDDGALTPEMTKIIFMLSISMILCISDILNKDKQTNTIPRRLFCYYDTEDNFFSIALGYAYDNKVTRANSIKYPVMNACFNKGFGVFFVSASNVHQSMDVFDVKHCDLAPSFEFGQDEINKMIGRTINPKILTSKSKTIISDDLFNEVNNIEKPKRKRVAEGLGTPVVSPSSSEDVPVVDKNVGDDLNVEGGNGDSE